MNNRVCEVRELSFRNTPSIHTANATSHMRMPRGSEASAPPQRSGDVHASRVPLPPFETPKDRALEAVGTSSERLKDRVQVVRKEVEPWFISPTSRYCGARQQ